MKENYEVSLLKCKEILAYLNTSIECLRIKQHYKKDVYAELMAYYSLAQFYKNNREIYARCKLTPFWGLILFDKKNNPDNFWREFGVQFIVFTRIFGLNNSRFDDFGTEISILLDINESRKCRESYDSLESLRVAEDSHIFLIRGKLDDYVSFDKGERLCRILSSEVTVAKISSLLDKTYRFRIEDAKELWAEIEILKIKYKSLSLTDSVTDNFWSLLTEILLPKLDKSINYSGCSIRMELNLLLFLFDRAGLKYKSDEKFADFACEVFGYSKSTVIEELKNLKSLDRGYKKSENFDNGISNVISNVLETFVVDNAFTESLRNFTINKQ